MHLNNRNIRQFLVFLCGGVASAVLDIGSMQLLIAFSFNPMAAATAGFFLGLIFNYVFHAICTFRASVSILVFIRFLAVVGINYAITIAFIYISLSILVVGALPGKIASLPIVAINGYLLSKYWVFNDKLSSYKV